MKRKGSGRAADVQELCNFYEMLEHLPPFFNEIIYMKLLKKAEIIISEVISSEARNLIEF